MKVPILRGPGSGMPRPVPIRRGAVFAVVVLCMLAVLAAGLFGLWREERRTTASLAAVVGVEATATPDMLVAAIAKKLVLPDDEPPRIAMVTEPERLSEEQEFYRGVSYGDILLVFERSHRAVLYSPKRDIVVNVGPTIASSNTIDETAAGDDINAMTSQ